jgi:ABC-2 type transport system permease protein
MNVLYVSVMNEVEKLLSRKKTIVFLVISALIPVLAAVALLFFRSRLGIAPLGAGEFPVWILGTFTGLLLPLFVCMTAVDLFTGELSDRTLKIVLLRPVSRLKIYLSKIIAISIYILINLGGIFLISLIGGAFLEWSDGSVFALVKALAAYAAAFLPMLLIGILSVFVSQFFKSSSGALAFCILLYFASKVASFVFPGIGRLLVTSFNDWHMLWLSSPVVLGSIINIFLFILSYSIIFLAAGYFLFDRREI